MPEIRLEGITKRFGNAGAVEDMNLVIGDGDFVTLLGPSGCGKTTTLRMIAGLERPSQGEIHIGDNLVFSADKGIDLPADRRGIGFLFQNYALWPHMTVRDNIVFGLENLKWPKERIRKKLDELLELLRIGDYVSRYPSELSGGQQQRVAIARTLAPEPSVLLMDEPLSNLDAKLRMEMRTELKRLHTETASTFVYVTHDQLEAMTLSTRVCLMREGRVQQYSPPLTVYGDPANVFTADFVGSPAINLIAVSASPEGDAVRLCMGQDISITFDPAEPLPHPALSRPLLLGLRPESVSIGTEGIPARVLSSLPSGMETILRLEAKGLALTSVVFGSIDFSVGQEVSLAFNSDGYLLFDAQSGSRLGRGRLCLV